MNAAAAAPERIDPRLLLALAQALDTARQAATRQEARAAALAELGDIELPDSTPSPDQAQQLECIAPLYLAHELEQAGMLRTAELVAGLFASGAITQPLGPTGQLIAEFWKSRRERLAQEEREQLFAQVFEPQAFYPQMQALCDALASQFDNPPREGDLRGQLVLQHAAAMLGDWLAPRAAGMASFAAQDIVHALSQATRFLRDRLLQTAFGVQDLWGLLDTVGSADGAAPLQSRRHVELGRYGATVLTWLANASGGSPSFDPASAEGRSLMMAAEAWRLAWAAPGPGGMR